MPTNLENSAVVTGLEKVSFHSNPKERQHQRMLKLPQIVLISHASKLMFKILQTVGNSERDGNTRPPDLPLEKPVCRSGSNS